jgi:hypothetical protein
MSLIPHIVNDLINKGDAAKEERGEGINTRVP